MTLISGVFAEYRFKGASPLDELLSRCEFETPDGGETITLMMPPLVAAHFEKGDLICIEVKK